LTKTNAFIQNSNIVTQGTGTGPGTGNVALDAENQSSIIATVVGASATLAGGLVGVGISVGAANDHNFIGYDQNGNETPAQVQAFVLNSSINASGDLSAKAIADETINAVDVAASAAVAIGLVGVA